MENATPQTPLTQRLAIARLRYNVNELQSKVDQTRILKPPTKKVFNCFVDGTALTEGITEIKGWVTDGVITLTVPLCTVDQLDGLKKGSAQENVNAREAIRFFDRAQSGRGKVPVRGVKIQAPHEQFSAWTEVEERFMLSDYLPSNDEPMSPLAGDFAEMLKLGNTRGSDSVLERPSSSSTSTTVSSANSPKAKKASLANASSESTQQSKEISGTDMQAAGHRRGQSTSDLGVPRFMQPLLNCVLWRIHKEHMFGDGISSFVLITNDLETLSWAAKFNVPVKRLEQLAQAIKREDIDFKSRLHLFEKNQSGSGVRNDNDQEDSSIFRSRASTRRPTSRPYSWSQEENASSDTLTSSRPASPKTTASSNGFSRGNGSSYRNSSYDIIPRGLMDPDSFGRSSSMTIISKDIQDVDFVLKSGIPREASRGKGKLWEP